MVRGEVVCRDSSPFGVVYVCFMKLKYLLLNNTVERWLQEIGRKESQSSNIH